MTDTTKIHTSVPAAPSTDSTDKQQKAAEQSVTQSDKARFKAKVQNQKEKQEQKLSDSQRKTAKFEDTHSTKNTHSLFKEAAAKRDNARQQPSIKKEQRQGQWTTESVKTNKGIPHSPSSAASAKPDSQQQVQAGTTQAGTGHVAQTGTGQAGGAGETGRPPLPQGFQGSAQAMATSHKDLDKQEAHELQALKKSKDSTEDKAAAVLQNLQSPGTLQHASTAETSATQTTSPHLAADTKQMFEEIQSISKHIMRTEQSLHEGGSLRIQLQSAVLPQTAVTFSLGAGGVLHATFSSNRKESLDKIREHKDALKSHVRSRSGVLIEVDTSDSETSERGSYP